MSEENQSILSQDGLKLHLHHWAVDLPNKVICIVHGLGEHGGRYLEMANMLNKANCSVIAIDLRGHGLSEGKRGHTPSYELLLLDIEELLKTARAEYTDTPMILFGHSMGGNLVANFVKTKTTSELSGFILSSPFFDVVFQPPVWKVKLAKIIGELLPGLLQSNELDVSAISRDANEILKYIDDPLVHDRISIRLFLELTKNGRAVLENENKLKINGLHYHGDADQLVSFPSSEVFAEKNKDHVKWIPLKDTYHEPHNDLDRENVYKQIREFIQESDKEK
ncbi:MAG: alpha/beta hydrolase [Cytophagales bacterium]|nr:alpha/beta hydrolase [Cytophagales bacterium]